MSIYKKDEIKPTLPIKFSLNDKVKHKDGGRYVITGLPDEYVIEATGEPAYAYRAIYGNKKRTWIRAQSVMEDGRFEFINPNQSKLF